MRGVLSCTTTAAITHHRCRRSAYVGQVCLTCRRRQDPQNADDGFELEFSLWCLNPACIFRQVGDTARSVIVTSGTLSPMTSFASELGVAFDSELEGEHVVPQKQAGFFFLFEKLQSVNISKLCFLVP